MEFITTGNRIAVENFDIGKIYTITWQTGNYKSLACTGKGTDFVMFQDQEPDLLFCLTMDSAITVSSIEEGGGGSGTNNYNELENKPSINGFVLVGNKTGADLGLASQSDLEDYATNASVVAGLATKQDALSSSQLAAVNSGITSALVTQIGTNTSAIAGKQDALSSSQLAAVNSGITSTDVAQITTNKNNISYIADLVDSGAKNHLINKATTTTSSYGITYTVNADKSITVTGTSSQNYAFVVSGSRTYSNALPLPKGEYIVKGGVVYSTTTPIYIQFGIMSDSSASISWQRIEDSNYTFTVTNDTTRIVYELYIPSGVYTTQYDYTFYPMICDKAAYELSDKYVPYVPTNQELYAMIQAL